MYSISKCFLGLVLMTLLMISSNPLSAQNESQLAKNFVGIPAIYPVDVDGGKRLVNRPLHFPAQYLRENPSTLNLLSIKEIQGRLELTKQQETQYKKYQEDIQRSLDVTFGVMTEDEYKRRSDEAMKFVNEIQANAQKEMIEMLLPHQRKQLDFEQVRHNVKLKTFVQVITTDPVKEKASISNSQVDMLKKRDEKLRKELLEEIRLLRIKYRNELVKPLDDEQKLDLKKIFGKDFFEK